MCFLYYHRSDQFFYMVNLQLIYEIVIIDAHTQHNQHYLQWIQLYVLHNNNSDIEQSDPLLITYSVTY